MPLLASGDPQKLCQKPIYCDAASLLPWIIRQYWQSQCKLEPEIIEAFGLETSTNVNEYLLSLYIANLYYMLRIPLPEVNNDETLQDDKGTQQRNQIQTN
eukprot:g43604.t1